MEKILTIIPIGETREVWAGFVKRQFSSCGQWLDPGFSFLVCEMAFRLKSVHHIRHLGSIIYLELFCLEITFKKSRAFSIHQNTPGGTGHGSGGMGRCHVSYSILGFEHNTRGWGLP